MAMKAYACPRCLTLSSTTDDGDGGPHTCKPTPFVQSLEEQLAAMERAGAEQAYRADQNQADMLRYREGCRLALPALEMASALIRGTYEAETVEEIGPEFMNEAEVSVGEAIDVLRAITA